MKKKRKELLGSDIPNPITFVPFIVLVVVVLYVVFFK